VALVLADGGARPAAIAAGCRVKGLALMQSGRREEGRDLQRRALDAATRSASPRSRPRRYNNLALSENHLGISAPPSRATRARSRCGAT
jgi:hypothetical protein